MNARTIGAPLAAAAVAVLVALVPVADGAKRRLTTEEQAAKLEADLKFVRDPAERVRIADELELILQQAGPTFRAERNKCQVMWHDAAVRKLEASRGPLTARAKVSYAARGRLAVRRMAAACLTQAWYERYATQKYTAHAFGAYLANNLTTLDTLFAEIASPLDREPPPADGAEGDSAAGSNGTGAPAPAGTASTADAAPAAEADPEAAVRAEAVRKARKAVLAMVRAAADFEKTVGPHPREYYLDREAKAAARRKAGEAPPVPPMARFHEALATVRDARDVLVGDADAAEGAGAAGPGEMVEITPEQAEMVRAIRTRAASLPAGMWDGVRKALVLYVGAAEKGLQLRRTRGKAAQLLGKLARASELAAGVAASPAVTERYQLERRDALEHALEGFQTLRRRDYAYREIDRLWRRDAQRRALETSGLSPVACQGLLYGQTLNRESLPREAWDVPWDIRRVVGELAWASRIDFSKTIAAFREFHRDQHAHFIRALEDAGQALPRDTAKGVAYVELAEKLLANLEAIRTANSAVTVVAKYRPDLTAWVLRQLGGEVKDLVGDERRRRGALYEIRDVGGSLARLEDLPLLEDAYLAAANRILGSGYASAKSTLGKRVSAGIASAARGRSDILRDVGSSLALFRLIRERVVPEAEGYAALPVENLAWMSVPPKEWDGFVAALDGALKRMLATYVPGGTWRDEWRRPIERLTAVHGIVRAAQFRTRDELVAGESDLDRLVRHLGRVAEDEPDERLVFAWAAGYHGTEAAVAMAAGYERTARWHLEELQDRRQRSEVGGFLSEAEVVPRLGRPAADGP